MTSDTGRDLTGKVIIVTGATSGIGFATAHALYQRGAKVYLAVRNKDKATSSIKRLEESKKEGSGQAIFLHLDLDDPKGVKASAEEFMKLEDRLDILINNAAIVAVDYELNESLGIQRIMVVNYFSTLIFTESLLPVLKKTDSLEGSDVRIVNLSSDAHKMAPDGLHFRTAEDFNLSWKDKFAGSMRRYGFSKVAMNLWTLELQPRLSASGSKIIVLAVHPGAVLTEGNDITATRMPKFVAPAYKALSRLLFTPVEKGIASTIWAATSPEVRDFCDCSGLPV